MLHMVGAAATVIPFRRCHRKPAQLVPPATPMRGTSTLSTQRVRRARNVTSPTRFFSPERARRCVRSATPQRPRRHRRVRDTRAATDAMVLRTSLSQDPDARVVMGKRQARRRRDIRRARAATTPIRARSVRGRRARAATRTRSGPCTRRSRSPPRRLQPRAKAVRRATARTDRRASRSRRRALRVTRARRSLVFIARARTVRVRPVTLHMDPRVRIGQPARARATRTEGITNQRRSCARAVTSSGTEERAGTSKRSRNTALDESVHVERTTAFRDRETCGASLVTRRPSARPRLRMRRRWRRTMARGARLRGTIVPSG
jgi:hypothetical protein